ncbi:MAG: hypothetical protein M0P43_10565 [Arcobacteraceae bacterium]|jgi:predicted DNA-binding transcriptional regulator AlpA|nr:hypothetical protein [Arcobacteraceae bacterium]
METHRDKTYQYLIKKYNRLTIGKKEMASELNISASTLDLYISKGMGLPRYKKLGTSKNARVVFNILDVSEFLNSELIETM